MSPIIFDAQILQTPAAQRGMGQYVTSLILSTSKKAKVKLILTNHLSTKEIRSFFKDYPIEVVELPLKTFSESRTYPWLSNQDTLNSWIRTNNLEGSAFIVGSIFQGEICPVLPSSTINAVIVYDIIPLQRHDEYRNFIEKTNYLERFKLIYESDHIFTDSNTVKEECKTYLSIDDDKVTSINGGPLGYINAQKSTDKPSDKSELGRFIFMPTGNDIRKNNERAIIAFEQHRISKDKKLKLFITSTFSPDEKKTLNNLSESIEFLGSISNEEVWWYYKNCQMVLFPSLQEGLGLPVIEAAIANKPIAASNIPPINEIAGDSLYYFNPHSVSDIADKIDLALKNEHKNTKQYNDIKEKYSWSKSSEIMVNTLKYLKKKPLPNTRIAVVSPHTYGFSAIGKFVAELHPSVSDSYKVDYYFESTINDKEMRPGIIEKVEKSRFVNDLTDKVAAKYSKIIYHIGNSSHHTLSFTRAMTYPSIVVLHDLNLANIFQDLLDQNIIDKNRYEYELGKNKKYNCSFLHTLAHSKNIFIVHSEFARSKLVELGLQPEKVFVAQLPVRHPNSLKIENQKLRVGLAGIVAEIKGLEIIKKLAQEFRSHEIEFEIFGFLGTKQKTLDELGCLDNINISTNLTDYEFHHKLQELDIFVNYRSKYQGEASKSTLEAMASNTVVIVRSGFGWYDEIPDGAVLRAKNFNDIVQIIIKLNQDRQLLASVKSFAGKTIDNKYNFNQYLNVLERALGS